MSPAPTFISFLCSEKSHGENKRELAGNILENLFILVQKQGNRKEGSDEGTGCDVV